MESLKTEYGAKTEGQVDPKTHRVFPEHVGFQSARRSDRKTAAPIADGQARKLQDSCLRPLSSVISASALAARAVNAEALGSYFFET